MNVNELREFFEECGEFYAVGYFEEPYKTPFERFSRAHRRYFENYRLPEYKGEPLYPCGGKWRTSFVNPDFSFTLSVDWRRLGEKSPAVKDTLWGDFWQYGSRDSAESRHEGNRLRLRQLPVAPDTHST